MPPPHVIRGRVDLFSHPPHLHPNLHPFSSHPETSRGPTLYSVYLENHVNFIFALLEGKWINILAFSLKRCPLLTMFILQISVLALDSPPQSSMAELAAPSTSCSTALLFTATHHLTLSGAVAFYFVSQLNCKFLKGKFKNFPEGCVSSI